MKKWKKRKWRTIDKIEWSGKKFYEEYECERERAWVEDARKTEIKTKWLKELPKKYSHTYATYIHAEYTHTQKHTATGRFFGYSPEKANELCREAVQYYPASPQAWHIYFCYIIFLLVRYLWQNVRTHFARPAHRYAYALFHWNLFLGFTRWKILRAVFNACFKWENSLGISVEWVLHTKIK